MKYYPSDEIESAPLRICWSHDKTLNNKRMDPLWMTDFGCCSLGCSKLSPTEHFTGEFLIVYFEERRKVIPHARSSWWARNCIILKLRASELVRLEIMFYGSSGLGKKFFFSGSKARKRNVFNYWDDFDDTWGYEDYYLKIIHRWQHSTQITFLKTISNDAPTRLIPEKAKETDVER